MVRFLMMAASLVTATCVFAAAETKDVPSFPYEVVRAHELKPHRHSIPTAGVSDGFRESLAISLTISPSGDVVTAKPSGDPKSMEIWPQVRDEVLAWKYTPFLQGSIAVTAQVQEYLAVVPPERLPKVHVAPPPVLPHSQVVISLRRSGCFGSCPAYNIEITTEHGILFDGSSYVVAEGKYRAPIDPDEVRAFAKRFLNADFYSMEPRYSASVTDCPSYSLSLEIDGRGKEVTDYMGTWVGMPAVIEELEEEVDDFAQTSRWILGCTGLVAALREEKFDFQSSVAQHVLKESARRGAVDTVRDLLESGVPLSTPTISQKQRRKGNSPAEQGWLTASSAHPEVLQMFIHSGASGHDQADKDLALLGAAASGNLEGVQKLIAYGANPNVDLKRLIVVEEGGGMTTEGPGHGSVLIAAAESGNPEVIREILRYRPRLEARDSEGKTAMFAAGDSRNSDVDGARVECVRLLAAAGADLNARDDEGNTPLHETFLTDVEEELLKLGANVNARNEEGETPIFTNVDNDSIALFLHYGADLTIRNKSGETVLQAAKKRGPDREKALLKALEEQSARN